MGDVYNQAERMQCQGRAENNLCTSVDAYTTQYRSRLVATVVSSGQGASVLCIPSTALSRLAVRLTGA